MAIKKEIKTTCRACGGQLVFSDSFNNFAPDFAAQQNACQCEKPQPKPLPVKRSKNTPVETYLEYELHGKITYFVRRCIDGELNLLLGTLHKASGQWAFQVAEHASGRPVLLYADELKQLATKAKNLEKYGPA